MAAPTAQQSGPVKGSLEQAPPRSRVYDSLERAPPRSTVRLRLARGLPRTHARPRTRVRAFNALTRRDSAIMRLGITPRPSRTNSLGEPIPATVGDCATWPVSAP
jgi:hypothetical protein